MTGSICDYFVGETITTFYSPTILWTGIGKRFWRGRRNQVPQNFQQTLNYQRIWYAFTNYRLSWASHAIPLSMMSCRGFFVRHKCQLFLLSFSHRGHWMSVGVFTAQISWRSRRWIWIPRGFCLKINLLMESSLILIQSPHFDINVETKERFCKMHHKPSSMSWLDKPSGKLIQFTLRVDRLSYLDMNVDTMGRFYKDASQIFFNEFGLISHQINSMNHLIRGNQLPHLDMNLETVERFYKDASWTFFNEFGSINHQINSFNQLIWLFGYLIVGSSFD